MLSALPFRDNRLGGSPPKQTGLRHAYWVFILGISPWLTGCGTFSRNKTPDIQQVNAGAASPNPQGEGTNTNGLQQASFTEGVATPGVIIDEEWAKGEEAYRAANYAQAEKSFHKVAENTNNPPLLAEKARFFEAECLRMKSEYPKAADTYVRMLNDFPSGVYRERAVGMIYQIANYWLEPTREEFKKLESASSTWMSSNYVNLTDKTRPNLDQEGRALELLTKVHLNDPMGPYSDKALYLIGYVNFVRGNYKESDHAFSQLVELHDKSPLRSKAAEMAIMAKNNSTGGPDYDGQKAAEALRMVQQARTSMPDLAKERGDFLDRQAIAIRQQQADKDFNMAEFYRRTGHPGSAWFYYELVRRRYPGTGVAEKAESRMADMQREMDEAQRAGDSTWAQFKRGFNRWVLGRNTDVNGYSGTLNAGSLPQVPDRGRPVDPGAMPAGGGSSQLPGDRR